MLKEPANLDVAFRYAEVSTKLHDFEAAIGALERMLFFNASLPRVKLELGVLYFRLGSYEMAKNYFTNAIADPAAPLDIRAKVQAYLDEIEKRLNPNFVSGLVQTGVRYQTNATAGPSGSLIRVFGFDGVLDQKFVKQPDWNFFAKASSFKRWICRRSAATVGRRRPVPMPPSNSRLSAWTLPPLGSRPGHASCSTPASHLARGFRSGPTSADRWLPSRRNTTLEAVWREPPLPGCRRQAGALS